jgi:hypothetical protein
MVTPLPARHVPHGRAAGALGAAVSRRPLVLASVRRPEGDPVVGAGPRGAAARRGASGGPGAVPDVPVWVGGAITTPGPARRALRWDGACLYRVPPPAWEDLTARRRRRACAPTPDGPPYVVAVGGRERREDWIAERRYVASLATRGADWWHEYVPPGWAGPRRVADRRPDPSGREVGRPTSEPVAPQQRLPSQRPLL